MKHNKQNKGISLIVLIITIAVIIILAAAVILSMNNNRPIESAKTATQKNDIATLKESAAVLSAQWEVDKLLDETIGTRTDYVQNGLTKQGFEQSMVNKVEVDENTGKVTVSTDTLENVGSAPLVASDPQKYYGAYVTNYTATNASVVGWKILYSDTKNIYLIADDYIPYDSIPYSKGGHRLDGYLTGSKYSQYCADFNYNIRSEYIGSSDIINEKLQGLNGKYYEYLKLNNLTSKNDNMKEIAFMMDTNVWSVFAGEKAEYAIGGPTLEIMADSYNAKYKLESRKITTYVDNVDSSLGSWNGTALGIDGYVLKQGNGNWANYILNAFYEESSGSINDSDKLYYIQDTSKSYGMWLSSPLISLYDDLAYITYSGSIGRAWNGENYPDINIYSGYGFRPLVCLKSGVVLEEQSDGSYIIK